jgi:hypothetical protein
MNRFLSLIVAGILASTSTLTIAENAEACHRHRYTRRAHYSQVHYRRPQRRYYSHGRYYYHPSYYRTHYQHGRRYYLQKHHSY